MMKTSGDSEDPFTGTWSLSRTVSRLLGPSPAQWTQQIEASASRVRVRETIVSADGARTSHVVDAQFDGTDYPVNGSRLVGTIAYTRPDRFRIEGTARNAGTVVFTELTENRIAETLPFLRPPPNPCLSLTAILRR